MEIIDDTKTVVYVRLYRTEYKKIIQLLEKDREKETISAATPP